MRAAPVATAGATEEHPAAEAAVEEDTVEAAADPDRTIVPVATLPTATVPDVKLTTRNMATDQDRRLAMEEAEEEDTVDTAADTRATRDMGPAMGTGSLEGEVGSFTISVSYQRRVCGVGACIEA